MRKLIIIVLVLNSFMAFSQIEIKGVKLGEKGSSGFFEKTLCGEKFLFLTIATNGKIGVINISPSNNFVKAETAKLVRKALEKKYHIKFKYTEDRGLAYKGDVQFCIEAPKSIGNSIQLMITINNQKIEPIKYKNKIDDI